MGKYNNKKMMKMKNKIEYIIEKRSSLNFLFFLISRILLFIWKIKKNKMKVQQKKKRKSMKNEFALSAYNIV